MPKVFISYSHDSDEHRNFVRGLSDQLRVDGMDCWIDQYINGFPPEGWQRWMEKQVETANFVLLVCTPNYLKRYRGEAHNGGHGVNFEGVVISQFLYDHYYQNTKFIPVIPFDGSLDHVPVPLKSFNIYRLYDQYEQLYRYLTKQPAHVAPPIGQIRNLKSHDDHSVQFQTSTSLDAGKTLVKPTMTKDKYYLQKKLQQLQRQYHLEDDIDQRMCLETMIWETEKILKNM